MTQTGARGGTWRERRTLLLLAAVSLGLVIFGIVVHRGFRLDPERAPMSEFYLSMTCQCPWHNRPKTLLYLQPGQPWSIHTVLGPYRYRMFVPWLVGHLPVAPETALSGTTYITLGISYWLILLTCRRLGLSAGASLFGLVLAYVFGPNQDAFAVPFRLDGFGLMTIAALLYAITVDAFWLFAIVGFCGLFARETTLLLLPVWCVRDLKRGLALTIVAVVAMLVARSLLFGPPDAIEPTTILFQLRLPYPERWPKDILSTWGWAFAATTIGISLLPANAFRSVGPMSLCLILVAAFSYFLASDTMRLFLVLLPVVALGAGRLIAVLAERRHYVLLASLLALVALQFLISSETRLSHNPAALAATIRPLWLGTAWAIAAVFVLRRELAQSVHEKLSRQHLGPADGAQP